MSRYIDVNSLDGSTELNIERITYVHILLLRFTDAIQPVTDLFEIFREGGHEICYNLMKKSYKKRWGDISFFNFNEDAIFSLKGNVLSLKMPDDTRVFSYNNFSASDKTMISVLYSLQNSDSAIERNKIKIRKNLSDEYNIDGAIINIEAVKNNEMISYVKKSESRDPYTLYFFHFYYLKKYDNDDLTSLISRIENSQQYYFNIIKNIIEKNRYGCFNFLNIKWDIGLSFIRDQLGHPAGVKIDGGPWGININPELFNLIQEDQINELASREISTFIPCYLLDKNKYMNEQQHDPFHPKYKFHSIVSLILSGSYPNFLTKIFRDELSVTYRRERHDEAKKIGLMFIDLVDSKQYFKKNNHKSGPKVQKSFQSDMARIITNNYGFIVNTAGDGIYAVIEYPPEEAKKYSNTIKAEIYDRLLRTALEIQGTSWTTRIGVDYSEDYFEEGYIGPLEIGHYTISGKNVNIAARIEKEVKRMGNSKNGIIVPGPRGIDEKFINIILNKTGRIDFEVKPIELSIPEALENNNDVPLTRYFHIYKKQ